MLKIENLSAQVDGKPVLKELNLAVNAGETHAIMGPNGSGKSTLSKILAGHPSYEITGGRILFDVNLEPQDLLQMSADVRAREGIFLAFQYPIEIPGVSNYSMLKISFDAICEHQGVAPMEDSQFRKLVEEKIKLVALNPSFLDRGVNEGFSGGEKKRNEILQMAVLRPRLAILDETDSGLDIDSLKIVASGVNKLRSKDNAILMITHYQRLLDYVQPDYVHVLYNGRIIKSGDKNLALRLEKEGYDGVIAECR